MNKPDPLAIHKRLGGKVSTAVKDVVDSMDKLSIYYTPGVGEVSRHLAANPEETRLYTNTHNNVAIVSDGSAVLGLGNIGPEAALPVMEGKAMLFKSFADVDAVPLVIKAQSVDEIVATVKAVSPSFGGINLEDIKAPECFEVERRLKAELNIPVFHDDQHGTAVVVLAGLINALKVRGDSDLADLKVVVSGAGAAGVAIIKLLRAYGEANDIWLVDSKGVVSAERSDLNSVKQAMLPLLSKSSKGSLAAACKDADVFIGVSAGGILNKQMVESMNNPIIFAMANPDPEIMPDQAQAAGAFVVATGRSDFPNQINNSIAFPGIFRGALDNMVKDITDEHKIAAAEAIASLVEDPKPDLIIPDIFDERLVPAIAEQITQ